MVVSPTQVVLLAALAAAFGVVYYYEGRGDWRARLEERFVYGVPWGTLVTVAVVVAFYLLAQDGLRGWSEPVIWPYISWSYLYPTGLLTAGLAHANPGHIVANMTGTLAFAPIAEYAWSHYAPGRRTDPPLSAAARDPPGLLGRPWVRAAVVFPAVLLGAALLTAVFSLGPGLGFSGAVFAIAGFAVVNYPLATVVAVVASATLRTLYTALTEPVATGTIEVGAPSPPPWAGVGWQAHLLGFLLGVVAAAALLVKRDRRVDFGRVFLGTLLLGTVQALWLVVWVDDEVFTLYRGAGVAMVAVLTVFVAAAAGGSDRAVPRPLSVLPVRPTRRMLAVVWVTLLALVTIALAVAVLVVGTAVGIALGTILLLAALLLAPAVPPLVPDRYIRSPVSRRHAAAAVVLGVAVLVAAIAVPFGLVAVGEDTAPGTETVEVEGYTLGYAEEAPSGQSILLDLGAEANLTSNQSGVILVDPDREIWTVAVRNESLAFSGNDTVVVGGPGWRQSVEANRTGWHVAGNGTVYAVDLVVDGERTRSFRSAPRRAAVRLDGHTAELLATDDGFAVRVREGDRAVGEAAIPAPGGSASVGQARIETRTADGTARVVLVVGDDEAVIAERETYR